MIFNPSWFQPGRFLSLANHVVKYIFGNENLPKSLDKFQDVKYTDETEYGILKAQVKGMTYYNKAVLNEPDITVQVKKVAENYWHGCNGT